MTGSSPEAHTTASQPTTPNTEGHTPQNTDPTAHLADYIPVHSDREITHGLGYPTYKGSKIHCYTFDKLEAAAGRQALQNWARQRLFHDKAALAEDLVQDTFLGFLISYGEKRPPKSKSSTHQDLLYGIASHKLQDLFRGPARRRQWEELAEDQLPRQTHSPTAEDLALEKLERDQYTGLFAPFRDTLKPQQQKLLDLLLIDFHMPAEDVAVALNITPGFARVAKHRLVALLRAEFAGFQGGNLEPKTIEAPGSTKVEPSKAPKRPQITVPTIHDKIVDTFSQRRHAGEEQIIAQIPAYIGQWTLAALDIKAYLQDMPGKSLAIIIFPYEDRLALFRNYIHSILGDTSESVRIETPATIKPLSSGEPLDYVAMPRNLDNRLCKQLLDCANFMLQLAEYGERAGNSEFTAPSFGNVSGQNFAWNDEDSVRVAREFYFGRGAEHLTAANIKQLAATGQSPTPYRITRDFRTITALRAAAFDSLAENPAA